MFKAGASYQAIIQQILSFLVATRNAFFFHSIYDLSLAVLRQALTRIQIQSNILSHVIFENINKLMKAKLTVTDLLKKALQDLQV